LNAHKYGDFFVAKQTRQNDKQANLNNDSDFNRILAGLQKKPKFITDVLKSRIGPGDWKLQESSFKLTEENETVDLLFSTTTGKKDTYVLVDISVPHMQIGQKYTLPAKAKLFQKQEKVPQNRIKKAIVLVRKGTETISARPSRIRCPIIEVQLERIVERDRPKARPAEEKQREHRDNKAPKQPQSVSRELLYALKEAIVHECLSTMHKRRNKYIRKGLWRWIEREILDPNVHFHLIILSSIYQGKAGEVLSRKFRTIEDFSGKIDEVIGAIFSKETNLADEIKKNSERHKKALKKFLACFSQTPPFEYLKTLFLKEFRSSQDGLKARLSVFTTLNQLLERCGFEGEKETQYPLEILDELGTFQGVMAGNYARLRIINASKKLKHLVPQADWGEEEIYQLRNQLAKALNLPAQEFNLNAFLPQAFVQDAKVLAEARKEAFKAAPSKDNKPDNRREKEIQAPAKDAPEIEPSKEAPAKTRVFDPLKLARGNRAESKQSARATEEQPQRPARRQECDEAHHRNFEYFGGQTEEDIDAVRLALAISRHEAEKLEEKNNKENGTAKIEPEFLEENDPKQPIKQSGSMGYPVNHAPPKKRPPQRNNSNSGNRNTSNRRRRPNKSNQNKRPRRPNNNNRNNGV
jgi:hypothetical protein